jgi:hypothetical protein
MFCFQNLIHKLYKGGIFSCILTLKYMWDEHKILTLKEKYKKKLKFLFFNSPTLLPSYLFVYLSK